MFWLQRTNVRTTASMVHQQDRCRVLIAEDEALIALDLAVLVESLGYQVIGPFATASKAMEAAAAAEPQIALLDRNLLDGSTGPALAQALHEQFATYTIIVSATPEGLEEGVDGIMQIVRKPFSEAAIQNALERAVATDIKAAWRGQLTVNTGD